MTELAKLRVTRRDLLRRGALVAASPILLRSLDAWAQAKSPTKVLDFQTYADVAKAEQEGEVVYYGHDGEAAIGDLLESFRKDFPKIKTSYVRAQTGALYAKITAERSAGRYQVDVLQLSDISPAVDFQKKGGYEQYVSPEYSGYKAEYLSNPPGYFAWAGVTFAGIAYNRVKVKAEEAPKTWKDLLDPRWRNAISCKISASGLQFVQWYTFTKLYGPGYWKEFAKQRPRAFDSRVQLFDRLAKGDDKVCALAEYAAYILYRDKGAEVDFVAPDDGLPATPLVVGMLDRAPHPQAARLFIDWAMSSRGQAFYQSNPNLIYGSLRSDAPPMATGKRLRDFKLLFPADFADYMASQNTYNKEWNAMLGL